MNTEGMDIHGKVKFLIDAMKSCYNECTTFNRNRVRAKRRACPWLNKIIRLFVKERSDFLDERDPRQVMRRLKL